jgi:hypothetical protein
MIDIRRIVLEYQWSFDDNEDTHRDLQLHCRHPRRLDHLLAVAEIRCHPCRRRGGDDDDDDDDSCADGDYNSNYWTSG